METKIIKAVFGGSRYTVTAKRTRTDYGQVLEISGVDLPSTFECIFSNSATSAGTGKKMILAAAEEARKIGKAFCLEVEPPTEEMAKRRIEFYKRIGFVLNEYPYMQPSLGEGKNPIPLMIMSYKEPLTKESFENIRKVLYREVYKVEE